MVLLNAEHISLSWGEKTLFDDVSFALEEQDKVGFIGINGTGKSTFLRILAGMREPSHWRAAPASVICRSLRTFPSR